MGASSANYNIIPELAPQCAGLKMYLNETFTSLRLNNLRDWIKHFDTWPKKSPLCIHAEKETTAAVLLLATLHNRPIHVCHVARKEEIEIIRAAKEKGLPVTCEVCPHHLFLTENDIERLGDKKGRVKPVIGTEEDKQALWDNLKFIDVFATDHGRFNSGKNFFGSSWNLIYENLILAPHTEEEKNSEKAPPGFPGLETILPLLLTAVNEGKMTLEDLVDKFYRNPKKIFNLPEQPNTYVEVDMDEEYEIPQNTAFSKAKWTPFAGMKVKGVVHRVVLRGETAYVDGKVLVSFQP